MTKKTGGRMVVDSLLAEGVRMVSTVPGESFLPVLDSLYDADTINLVATRHEEGAGFVAEGYAKACGEVGVAMATRGVGVTNMSIALHTARQDSTPMVALIGQVPISNKYREAFQEIDQVRFLSPLVKWAIEIPSADRVPELMQQAFRVARSERPGPVVVALPEDVLYDSAEPGAPRPSIRPRPPRPSRAALDEVHALIREASNPLVLVGREVLATDSVDLVRRWSEALDLPVMTAFRRFDAFPNDHANYVGNISLGTPDAALDPIEEADLVVGIGIRFTEITTKNYRYPKPSTRLVHVSGSPEVAGVWGHDVVPVVADVRAFLEDSLAIYDGSSSPGSPSGSAGPNGRHTARYRKTFQRLAEYDAVPAGMDGVNISGVVRSISKRVPRDSAIVTDAGNFSVWVSRYYPFVEPLTHFGPISGAMGYGLPASLGVSLANRDRLVFNFVGDGGFAMTMNELAVAKEHNLPVVSLVFVNGMYGTIRTHQEKHYPGRPVGTDLCNPSFAAIGKAFGIDAFEVRNNAQFDSVLDDLVASPRPAVVEIFEGEERLTAWGNLKG
jgi:acetolactate synthase-1/2/3 large subunit